MRKRWMGLDGGGINFSLNKEIVAMNCETCKYHPAVTVTFNHEWQQVHVCEKCHEHSTERRANAAWEAEQLDKAA